MSDLVRDLLAIAWTALGLWLLRHDLFEREPQDPQAADVWPSSNLHLGADPGESAPSRSEHLGEDFTIEGWPVADVERTLAEIAAL